MSMYGNVWQKPLQYCKVISLQLIKIHGKKSHMGTTKDQHTHERNNIRNTSLKTVIKSQENRTKGNGEKNIQKKENS